MRYRPRRKPPRPPRPGRAPTPLPPEFAASFAGYAAKIGKPGGPLDADTVRAYLSRVRQYLAWLATAAVDGDPLADPHARDWAVRDYRTHQLTVAKHKASTVNAHLAGIDDFYRRLGLGPAQAKRQDLPKTAPRALDARARLRWLRSADRASTRDKALAFTEFYAGTRGSETVALDLDDVPVSARKGHLIVRYGKGGKYREVPLHPKLRAALEAWLPERAELPGAQDSPALFLNHLDDADRWACLMGRRSAWALRYRWLPLGGGHRALGDCQTAYELLCAMTVPARQPKAMAMARASMRGS